MKVLATSRLEATEIAFRALEFVSDVRITDCSGTEYGYWVEFDPRVVTNADELADVVRGCEIETN